MGPPRADRGRGRQGETAGGIVTDGQVANGTPEGRQGEGASGGDSQGRSHRRAGSRWDPEGRQAGHQPSYGDRQDNRTGRHRDRQSVNTDGGGTSVRADTAIDRLLVQEPVSRSLAPY